jgi:competence protein ComEC
MGLPAPLAPLGLAVAAGALAGVVCAALAPSLPPVAIAWAFVVVGLAALARGRRGARLAGAFLLGLGWTCVAGQQRLEARLPPANAARDALVVGRVHGLPETDAHSVRFDFEVEREAGAGIDAAPALAGRRLRLAWYRAATAPPPEPGSRWRFAVRVRPPHGLANPGGFDSERHALVEGIDGVGYVRGDARRLEPGAGIDATRDALSRAIAARVHGASPRFVQALALGDTRGLSDADWDVLRATGLTHLIAISGFHVGMVAGVGAGVALLLHMAWPALGRRVPRPQAAALAACLAATAYTALAGFALPTVRTLLMIGAVASARVLRRHATAPDAFALALLVVLAFDPLAVLAPGFWLSFVGVAWLLWCLPARADAGRVRPFLASQAVALVGLLPLGIAFFGQASAPAPLTNLVAIPAISFGIVPVALAGTAALALPGPLADVLLTAAAWAMDALWSGAVAVADGPLGVMSLPEPGGATLVLAAIGAAWLLMPRGTPLRVLGLVLLLPLLWPRLPLPAHGEADVIVLDVGQGLAVLVRTRDHALLFDAGPANARGLDQGDATVVPALHALGVRRLDAIIASHGDNDHAGGLGAVRRAFPQARVFAPEGWAGRGMQACERGQRWRRDGVGFALLHPPPLMPYLRNDSSCVLRIEAAGAVALLPGDIGRHVETRLVREQAAALRADLLVAPHHGSLTSSSEPFVAAVAPRWVVFATGHGNRFALPRADVVARYAAAGAHPFTSGESGAVAFRLGRDGVVPRERRRQDRPRWWRERAGSWAAGGAVYPSDGPGSGRVTSAGTDQSGRLDDGAAHRAGHRRAGDRGGAVLEPAAQGSAAARARRGSPRVGPRPPARPEAHRGPAPQFAAGRAAGRRARPALPAARAHQGARRGRGPPRHPPDGALPEHARHDRLDRPAARPARHGDRHDRHVPGDPHRRRRRREPARRRHRPGADLHRRGPVRGDPGGDVPPLLPRPHRRVRHRDGEAGDRAARCHRRGRGPRGADGAQGPPGRGMKFHASRGLIDEPEINLISLIDVLLCIILFLVLTATFVTRTAMKLQLPSAAAGTVQDEGTPLVVVVDQQGNFTVGSTEVARPGAAALREALLRAAGDDRTQPVILRADARTPHQAVVTAMDALGQLGFTRLSIATTPETKPAQR